MLISDSYIHSIVCWVFFSARSIIFVSPIYKFWWRVYRKSPSIFLQIIVYRDCNCNTQSVTISSVTFMPNQWHLMWIRSSVRLAVWHILPNHMKNHKQTNIHQIFEIFRKQAMHYVDSIWIIVVHKRGDLILRCVPASWFNLCNCLCNLTRRECTTILYECQRWCYLPSRPSFNFLRLNFKC